MHLDIRAFDPLDDDVACSDHECGFAFDRMTHVGEMDGVYYSLGYAGHGVAMATYLGKTLANAMIKGTIKEHPFNLFPFPSAPLGLYNGFPWFLPLAGAWHKILDWVE